MKDNKTVLLLEDDLVDAMTVRRVFKQIKIMNKLVIRSDGEEGLEWLNQNRENLPSLILLDLNMPRMNGLEFLAVIKNDPIFKIIPTIVLTTSNDQRDRLESFQLQVAGYIVKPVDYDKFVHIVKQIKSYWKTSELAY